MKYLSTIFGLLILLCCTKPVQAQKAYDLISYQTTIYGNKMSLQLADGYLLASKVTIHSRSGDQVFSPSQGEPDAGGDLRFDPVKSTGRFKANKGSWLILKKLNGPVYPAQLGAVYWNGKTQQTIVLLKVDDIKQATRNR